MENIIAAEILCTKLQESERPLEISIGIALRVILDENITLEERYQEEKSKINKQNVSIVSKMATISALETENNMLKSANRMLTIEIEYAKAVINLYKNNNKRVLYIAEGVGKPIQTSIEFPVTSSPKATQVNYVEKSVYYKAAMKRAVKIFAECKKDEAWFKLSTRHIVFWENKFFLQQDQPLTLDHIKVACLPKCYEGLGSNIGILLEKWAYNNSIKPKEC